MQMTRLDHQNARPIVPERESLAPAQGGASHGASSCLGCSPQEPCAGCGGDTSGSEHLRGEWADLVAASRPGASSFWREAIRASAYFSPGAEGALPDPRHSISVGMRIREQFNAVGAEVLPLDGVGGVGTLIDEHDWSGRDWSDYDFDAAPDDWDGFAIVAPPPDDTQTPRVGCCCPVSLTIEAAGENGFHWSWPRVLGEMPAEFRQPMLGHSFAVIPTMRDIDDGSLEYLPCMIRWFETVTGNTGQSVGRGPDGAGTADVRQPFGRTTDQHDTQWRSPTFHLWNYYQGVPGHRTHSLAGPRPGVDYSLPMIDTPALFGDKSKNQIVLDPTAPLSDEVEAPTRDIEGEVWLLGSCIGQGEACMSKVVGWAQSIAFRKWVNEVERNWFTFEGDKSAEIESKGAFGASRLPDNASDDRKRMNRESYKKWRREHQERWTRRNS